MAHEGKNGPHVPPFAAVDEPVPVRRFRFAPAKVVMAAAVLGVLVLAGVQTGR